ncbi:MAG: PSD1 domain-containing protein [Armatimonadetes bacterium]|nr:PSD1 domain-containing protein [Armatimonadota bacterium]
MRSASIGIGVGILTVGLVVPALPQGNTKKETKVVSYANDVAPILKSYCYSCHSGAEPAADLNLAKTDFTKSDVIKLGDPEHSTLIRRMKGLDGLPSMPQGFKPLEAAKIQVIADWIKQGAKVDKTLEKHWSYLAPVMPEIPQSMTKWGANAIDAFTLEKMTEQKLKPSPEASKEMLCRRVYLDLIGLPPTVAEVDAYLSDKSPNAYEKLVDKLLASKHFGERQARGWLDIARYADTNGYEADRIRNAYLYRDWVIDAFNQNMPYDRFTVEQLAGDMLPNATIDDKVATGFNRNSMFNEEGGVDPAESFYNVVIDRVTTTSTTWLGTTMQCSRCHDHKFDPFTQKDFYKLYAIFSNVQYRRDGDYSKSFSEHWIEPEMRVMQPQEKAKYDVAKAELATLEKQRAQIMADNADDYAQWSKAAAQPVPFVTPKVESVVSDAGSSPTVAEDQLIEVGGKNPDNDQYQITLDLPKGDLNGLCVRTIPAKGKPQGRASSENFVLTDIGLTVDGQKVRFAQAKADFVQDGYNVRKLLNGDRASGWAVAPNYADDHCLVVQFEKPIAGNKAVLTLGFHSKWKNHNIARFRVGVTPSKYPLLDTMKVTDQNRADAYIATSPVGYALDQKIEDVKSQMAVLESESPVALVMEEKPTTGKITAPVHHRGEFLSPGDPVEAGTPAVLPKPDGDANMNRLEFAKWLVNGKNPLTARVEVNRIWEQYFGRGIVETLDDFGTQGSPPTNQKLLDYLAVKFVQSGWDMKAIHKMIVMSATYRQSSAATADAMDKDPTNVYLSHGPRFRMEAEMIRDSALTISGLLNAKVGGPSVMPYQPPGIWDSPYNGEQWMESSGDDRYRRGIYVFTKRTAMYPTFATFDSGTRESCMVRRIRTNSPLQALALLNDKAYLEAAKALGQEMLAKGSLTKGITFGFRAATSRRPTTQEVAVLEKAFNQFESQYTKDPAQAKKLGKDVNEAAWTMVGNILLNLDETITKE